MPVGLYKPGQGNYSRGIAAAGLAAVGIWGAWETRAWIQELGWTGTAGAFTDWWLPALILGSCLWGVWFVANRAATTDFIIETETEMKKVTWPSTREVVNATVVVIIVTVVLGLYMFFLDRVVYTFVLQRIGILPKPT